MAKTFKTANIDPALPPIPDNPEIPEFPSKNGPPAPDMLPVLRLYNDKEERNGEEAPELTNLHGNTYQV